MISPALSSLQTPPSPLSCSHFLVCRSTQIASSHQSAPRKPSHTFLFSNVPTATPASKESMATHLEEDHVKTQQKCTLSVVYSRRNRRVMP
ncbi:hypothetical protein M758_10G061600 [Ceratodon purpureus]|nr:hypothetical protein M758_10G061600 [Ceratodon purpureus]